MNMTGIGTSNDSAIFWQTPTPPPLCMGFDAQPFPLVAQNGIDTGIAASSGKEIAGQEGYSLVEK
jgi:hypothetical protein